MTKSKKKETQAARYYASANQVYQAIADVVEEVLAEAGITGICDAQVDIIQADIEFDAWEAVLDHIDSEWIEGAVVDYPTEEELKAEFYEHATEHPHTRLLEAYSDDETFTVKLRVGGYTLQYLIPTIKEV